MIEAMELLYLHNNSLTGTLDNLRSGVNLRKLKWVNCLMISFFLFMQTHLTLSIFTYRVSNNNLDGEVTSVLDNMKYLEVLSLNGMSDGYTCLLFVLSIMSTHHLSWLCFPTGNNLVGSRMDILRHLPNLKILDDEFIVPGSWGGNKSYAIAPSSWSSLCCHYMIVIIFNSLPSTSDFNSFSNPR